MKVLPKNQFGNLFFGLGTPYGIVRYAKHAGLGFQYGLGWRICSLISYSFCSSFQPPPILMPEQRKAIFTHFAFKIISELVSVVPKTLKINPPVANFLED